MTGAIEPTGGTPGGFRRPIPPSPIHPLAALATIVLDNIFGVVELFDPLAILITSLSVGVVGTLATTLVSISLPGMNGDPRWQRGW